jgi:hypothetical protein
MIQINQIPSSIRFDAQEPVGFTVSGFTGLPVFEAVSEQTNGWAGKFDPRLKSPSEGGTNAPQSLMSVDLVPLNRTQQIAVNAYDAKLPAWQHVTANITVSADGVSFFPPAPPPEGEGVSGAATLSFEGVTGDDACAGGDCFVEAEASGFVASRSLGLSTTAGAYDWTQSSFNFCINLGQINLGSIWIDGTPVVGAWAALPPLQYKIGDVFRVGVEDAAVVFRQNGRELYRHTPPAIPANLLPIAAFVDPYTQLAKLRFWQTNYGVDTKQAQVWGALPLCADRASEREVRELAEISEAESQLGAHRVVRYLAGQEKWDLTFTGRRLSELQAMREFRAFHRLHIPFYLKDGARETEKLAVFDSGVKDRLVQENQFDLSCTVKEY